MERMTQWQVEETAEAWDSGESDQLPTRAGQQELLLALLATSTATSVLWALRWRRPKSSMIKRARAIASRAAPKRPASPVLERVT
jgi:hypothetical protein